MPELNIRRATINDLPTIIKLLATDDLGMKREKLSEPIDNRYIDAFHAIDSDPNQYLMVVHQDELIIGTCHLTIMPSLTFIGSSRLQIEAVRVLEEYRGKKIGQYMINAAINYGKSEGATILQLTTSKTRHKAKIFYEKLGFEATHEGMKLDLTK